MKHWLAIGVVTLALAPAAHAQAPVTSVSVTVVVGSAGTTIAEQPAVVCASPELTMMLDQRPVRWRRGVPVLAAGRSYRFAGRLTCEGVAAPPGTVGDGFTVGANGRIVTRVAYRGARTIEFRAHGAAVRIAVRAR